MENIIASERNRFERALRRVNGPNTRDDYRAELDVFAGRYALGKLDDVTFRARVSELIRRTEVTAARQDQDADRAPWATMPADGSGRLGWFARVLYGVTGAVCLVVLGWVAALVWSDVRDAGNPPATPLPAAASVTGIPAGPGTPDRDAARELIIEGAYLSWWTYSECGRGPAECDAVLRDVNANPYGVHFFEDGSAVDPARN